MKYKFLEHTADSKFQAFGKTLEECFTNAALALFSIMVDIKEVKPKKTIKVKCSSPNIEELLIEWLNSLLAESSINNMVFSKFKVKIKNNNLEGEAVGETLNKQHNPKIEVKAATYSELFVKKQNNKYICQVVVDI